jgi:hypothetical protein
VGYVCKINATRINRRYIEMKKRKAREGMKTGSGKKKKK